MKVIPTKVFLNEFDKLEKSDYQAAMKIVEKIKQVERWELIKEKLVWYPGLYKSRIWKYRLIYMQDGDKIIVLATVRKREVSYRDLDKTLANIRKYL